MTDNDKQRALKALETVRAGLENPHGFLAPDYATADAEPVAMRDDCYIFQLTPPLNGYTGLVLADAIYPIVDKVDLARAFAAARGWRWVQHERRMEAEQNGRKRKR